uniref:ADP-ribosylglycohydrolase n=1 Tax=Coccidioides posadasii RMSCC 3488 TaxID=454284 RepID=A0A0J6FK85_COCPO|nr:ADP-ribosylglycohydrolase [Coccidioides posadasii RMSCC 3488]
MAPGYNKSFNGAWTDDTDHALLILLSVLHHNGKTSPNDLAERLKIWVHQGLRALDRPPLGLGETVGSVILDKEYLTDPAATAYRHWVDSGRKIAPNGSLMRTHPLGIVRLGGSFDQTCRVATAFFTHVDPRRTLACCMSTGFIRGILRREILGESDVDDVIECVYQWVDTWAKCRRADWGNLKSNGRREFEDGELLDRQEFNKHVQAQTFEELQLDDSMKIGYVYKCLGAAILSLRMGMRQAPYDAAATTVTAALPYPTIFENIITELTLAAGDTDTDACAAGALLGCWLGYGALPSHWRHASPKLKYRGRDDSDTHPDGGKGLMSKEEREEMDRNFMKHMEKQEKGVEQEKNRLEKERKLKQRLWGGMLGQFIGQ